MLLLFLDYLSKADFIKNLIIGKKQDHQFYSTNVEVGHFTEHV